MYNIQPVNDEWLFFKVEFQLFWKQIFQLNILLRLNEN